jgi:hypothetical protein
MKYLAFILLLLTGCSAVGDLALSTTANALGNVLGNKLEDAYDEEISKDKKNKKNDEIYLTKDK